MSLSNIEATTPAVAGKTGADEWGVIYTPGGERSLSNIEHVRSTQWTEADEADYLARIRQKAMEMATSIVSEARGEAESIREAAHKAGYEQGLAEADAELEQLRTGMADSVSAVLSAIEGQCSHIFDQWRDALVGVTRLSVEKMTGIVLQQERQQVLEALLAESVAVLEKSKELVICVNHEDEPMLQDIIAVTKERYPDIRSWRVKADAGITPGGMVVESESSLASGTVESRQAAVEQVLAHLTLPDVTP